MEAVAERYAIGLTPALAGLIDPARPGRSDRAAVPARPARARPRSGGTRRSDRRRREEPGQGARPSLSRPRADQARRRLRRLLPLLLPPGAGRAGVGVAERSGTRRSARLYPRPAGDLGGHPDRRRPADAVAAPRRRRDRGARGDRARQGPALAYPPAGRRSGARDDGAGAGADGRGRTSVVAVHANHPRELTAAARAACRRLAGAGRSCWSARACCSRASTTTSTRWKR